jgi:hypothetical protein
MGQIEGSGRIDTLRISPQRRPRDGSHHRREINEGLKVIENVDSANNFFFSGEGRNDLELIPAAVCRRYCPGLPARGRPQRQSEKPSRW